jgi:hypothetical protein
VAQLDGLPCRASAGNARTQGTDFNRVQAENAALAVRLATLERIIARERDVK